MKELTVWAAAANLDAVLEFISTELEAHGCPVGLQTKILIAAEEVFVNIAHYAYPMNAGRATIRISVEERVVIQFEDSGLPFNPLMHEEPDIAAASDQREIGGLGIFMVKQIMDEVQYRREGDKNLLTMKK